MESLRELFRIGYGPSSSHTMAPRKAAEIFKGKYPNAVKYKVTLFGSLAATGKGHLTDQAINESLSPLPVMITWKPDEELPYHPNGMQFEAVFVDSSTSSAWQVYSLGGGALGEETSCESQPVYNLCCFRNILDYCEKSGKNIWEYVQECEGQTIWEYLAEIWNVMQKTIDRGLIAEGVLPGGLGVPRKAWSFYRKTSNLGEHARRSGLLSAYALATSEENSTGGQVVTSPTCGSSGVLPAILRYIKETINCSDESILHGLATAGLIGNLIKFNASISGAEVGCQGEVGAACAMAAGAATQLMGGTVHQVEYAAEMGLEHHLGLTCDPVAGLVQIPCIERNAFAANKALTCAEYSLFTDGIHRISFDEVVAVMLETGNNLPSLYRETSSGGLAVAYQRKDKD